MRHHLEVLTLALACFIATTSTYGCSVSLSRLRNSAEYSNAAAHSIFVDGDGRALKPDTLHAATTLQTGSTKSDSMYGAWIHGILDSLRASHRQDILIRIHGGMNTLDEQVADTDLTRTIMAESNSYPIYINWESSIKRSYVDHLLYIRQGQARRGWDPRGVGGAPFYLIADAGQAVARAPITIAVQTANFFGRTRTIPRAIDPRDYEGIPQLVWPKNQADPCATNAHPATAVGTAAIEFRPYCANAVEGFVSPVLGILTGIGVLPTSRRTRVGRATLKLPSHFLWHNWKLASPWLVHHIAWVPIVPLTEVAVDMVGRAGYANMRRRTKTMFRQANEFTPEPNPQPLEYRSANGAVAQLMDSIQQLVQPRVDRSTPPLRCDWARGSPGSQEPVPSTDTVSKAASAASEYRVSVVGHSMGAIVAAEIVRACPGVPYRNIVFMAAAATVAEFEHGVLPHLVSDTSSRFFNLTLQPRADRQEWPAHLFFVTRGSLLSWIDGFIYTPETDADRVIGKYENAVSAIHILPDSVRSRAYLKSFGYHGPQDLTFHNKPSRHGDFSSLPFWKCSFWIPDYRVDDCAKAETPKDVGTSAPRTREIDP